MTTVSATELGACAVAKGAGSGKCSSGWPQQFRLACQRIVFWIAGLYVGSQSALDQVQELGITHVLVSSSSSSSSSSRTSSSSFSSSRTVYVFFAVSLFPKHTGACISTLTAYSLFCVASKARVPTATFCSAAQLLQLQSSPVPTATMLQGSLQQCHWLTVSHWHIQQSIRSAAVTTQLLHHV
jgi:hypothetical protein